MSIFNLFGSSCHVDDDSPIYTDTDRDGESSPETYMYRAESDDSYTPLTKSEYEAETKDDWKNGYYNSPIFQTDDDEPKKGWFGLW
ncbi:MAG: hypothetical protein WCQ26_06070 [Pseudanabaena sp. ELA748]